MKRILLLLIIVFFIQGCSGIPRPGIFEESEPVAKPEQKEDDKKFSGNILNYGVNQSVKALVEAVEWAKWDIAFINEEAGTIILKEAYVYRKDGKLLRVYHWPEGQYIASSDISDYIDKVTTSSTFFSEKVSFTQESMRIELTEISGNRTEINFVYTIRPFKLSESIKSRLSSSGYIENLILERASKSL